MKKTYLLALALAMGFPVTSSAQEIGVAAHAGTLGLGVDVALSVHPRVNVRAGGNFFPTNLDLTIEDIAYSVDLPSPQFTGMVDLFLLGSLRLTGGVLLSTSDISVTGSSTQAVTIGPTTYQPSEIGTLTGVFVTSDLAPYLGIGFGNIARSKFGFFLDLGVALQGEPTVGLSATGNVATLVSDLQAEARTIEESVTLLKYYPVLTIGFSLGFSLGS